MNTILVIEDEPDVRANLIEILDAEGYQVIEAANGRVGVGLACEHLPDMILCDITMPELDGYGVLDVLRADPATAMLPFVFLTARADRAAVRQGMNLGADDYLTKPFTRDDLIQTVTARLCRQTSITQRVQDKLNALRSSVTQALPHEFRTPLTSILGYTEILLEDYATLPPEDTRQMVQSVNTAAQRLQHLLINFLLYTELQIATRNPEYTDNLLGTDMHPLAAAAGEGARTQAQLARREADLSLDLQPADIQLYPSHINKITQELISNAFKFSETWQPVRVVGRVDAGRYTLSVEDHGRGMTAEQIANVGAYLQFDRRRQQRGSGLGLGIVKALAELQGGELRIESTPGRQTVVTVILPLTRPPADEP